MVSNHTLGSTLVYLFCPDLFEARAILLGRLGKHEAALDIYVNRLHDPAAAERFAPCKGRTHCTNPSAGIVKRPI